MSYDKNPSSDTKCRVTYNPTPITNKPESRKDVARISNGVSSRGEWTVSDFVKFTQPPFSYTVAPAIFKDNHRKADKWQSQQAFMLDFDTGITPEEVYQRFEHRGIIPNFYYYTLSHSEELCKFRVGLVLDEEVVNDELAKSIRKGLLLAFPEADKACSDASRMFFPGSKSVESSLTAIPLNAIYEFCSIHIVANDKHRKRHLLAENAVAFINIKEGSGFDQNSSNSIIKDPFRLKYLEGFQSSGLTASDLSGKVKIYDDFIMGRHLSYNELKGLATNLQYIRGGQKVYFSTLDATGSYADEDYALFHFIKHYNYYPMRLENFSPHEQDHQYSDMLEALKKPSKVQQVDIITPIPLQEAEEKMEKEFHAALESDDKDIYIFKTATGLGKTKLLETLDYVTICFPTHDLKLEADNRFISKHICIPSKPEFSNPVLNETINEYYQLGLNGQVRDLIQQVARKEHNPEDFEDDVDKAMKYLEAESNTRNTKHTVLSTHQRGVYNQSQHDTIVFDEDPMNSIFDMGSFKISELKIIEYELGYESLRPLIEELEAMPENKVVSTSNYPVDTKTIQDIVKTTMGIKGNVVKFFESSSCLKDPTNKDLIHYVVKRDLPKDKKVIIMSATAHIEAYKALYGERVHIIDLSNVEQKGTVIQYADKSYSRMSIAGMDREDIQHRCKRQKVITFQRYKNDISEALSEVHFHNTEGYDHLKGQNLVIFGTPHYPELVYKFYAHELGWDIHPKDFKMKSRMVERNGFRFSFTTFGDIRLQQLQLGLIESEMVQAVGRARTLRTEAEVTVFSNLPLAQATEMWLNYPAIQEVA